MQAAIDSIGIAVPKPVSTERFLEIDERMRARHGQSREVREMMRNYVLNSRIKMRHSVNPAWHAESDRDTQVEDIFTPHDFDPPAHLRAKLWDELAPKLGIEAAKAALKNWKGSPKDITHVVTTSSTGWAEPGISVALIEALGLSEDTRKIEININGCFCGASCLRTARDIIRGGEAKAVLVVAVELCSMQYNILETDPSSLISSSLFSDGAGAAIITPVGEWNFIKAGMSLVPDSKHLLRLHPEFDHESNAYKMFLHQGVASALADYFSSGRGEGLLSEILQGAIPPKLAVHPGGPRILDGIESVLIERGWPRDCLKDSFAILHENGNLGAAAILFVLHRLIYQSTTNDIGYFAFGPGVTVEWGYLKRN